MVNIFDSNFEFLKDLNDQKFQVDNIKHLPNKYLNKLHVSNRLYTDSMESKNLKTNFMKVKNLFPYNIINKIVKIDSINNTLVINNAIKIAKSNKDSFQQV